MNLRCLFIVLILLFSVTETSHGEAATAGTDSAGSSTEAQSKSSLVSAKAEAGAEPQAAAVIGSIKTAGNRSVGSEQILSKVRSRVGEVFDPATAAEDAKRIAGLSGVDYAYYNTDAAGDKIGLTFVVVEKDIVRSIVFVGNHGYKAGTLRNKLGLKTGDYFSPVVAEVGRRTLAEFYQKGGYAFSEVSLDSEKLSLGELVYTIDEGPRVRIAAVRFRGNSSIKAAALRKAVKTHKRKFVFWQRYYVEEQVDADAVKLQSVYIQRGFLDAAVTVERQFNKDKSRVVLAFVINEGPVYTIEKIIFAGNVYFDGKRLQSKLEFEQGQVYSERKADSGVKQLVKLYQESGFIDVRVEQNRHFISKNKVDVELEIVEGQRFRIGQVNITGNEQTQDKVIRRVLDEYDFMPGQWYNADIARGDGSGDLEKMIRSMVLTEAATITPTDSPRPADGRNEAAGQKDAQVNVVEGQSGMVMVGAGVASDSGVIGQLVFEQKNFDISDKPDSFYEFITGQAFKGAGQDFRISLQPGTEVSEYSVSFSDPYFRGKPITLDVVGSSYERGRECYDEGRMRGGVGFEKRYKSRWRRSVSFRAENVDVDGIDFDAPKEIQDVKGGNNLVGVRFGVGKDLTNDRFTPSSGYSFDVGYEQVGGDYTFGILSGTYGRYKTLYEDLAERKTVLATRLYAATVAGDAPPFEKFYAGGQSSIRGFNYRGVSTRGLQTNVANPEREDPIGSNWIFLASGEVTVPLVSDNLAALFFIDSGAIDTGNYRAAAGTGIQILVPQWFGPVPMRFEFAVPLMKDNKDDTQVFSFSVGRLF